MVVCSVFVCFKNIINDLSYEVTVLLGFFSLAFKRSLAAIQKE